MYGRTEGRHKVAQAWSEGRAYSQGNVSTDGHNVYSYGHLVGYCLNTGERIALDCHYSVTTAKHCSTFKGVASAVEPCWTCNPAARMPHLRPQRAS